MKIGLEKIKGKLNSIDLKKISSVSKNFIEEHHKAIGSGAVIAALVTVCSISLVARIQDSKTPSGVMMTLASVAEDEKPFSGNTYEMAAVSYDEMLTVSYESSQLAQLEKSEKQIDEILSSRRQDEKDQAAYAALTAQNQQEATEEVVAPVINPNVVVTYADANGTYTYVGEFVLTAYCPCPICCGQWSNMITPTTASGAIAVQGVTIAADTSVLPFGTRVNINGQIYTVQDTGGAIKGNRIDIFFNNHQEALQFGRRSASVYIVQ